MHAPHLPLNPAVPLTGIGIGLGTGVGLTAGILLGSVEAMLIGAVAGAGGGVIVRAIADMLSRTRGLHPAAMPVLTVLTGVAAGALIGRQQPHRLRGHRRSYRRARARLAFNWIAKPNGGSP